MSHVLDGGDVLGWGPTVREIDYVADLFDEVVHVGCLDVMPAPAAFRRYSRTNIRFVGVTRSGGTTLAAKLGIFWRMAEYVRVITRELAAADAVHLRMPSNVGAVAWSVLWLTRSRRPAWFKYAGNWSPGRFDYLGYVVQRALLRSGLAKGVTTVNSWSVGLNESIRRALNPCMSESELAAAAEAALVKPAPPPLKLLFVGRCEEEKGAERFIDICERVAGRGVPFSADVTGDGPLRERLEARVASSSTLRESVRLHGWVSTESVHALCGEAHFIVLPTRASEGWPKVLSEGMAYGAVPVASNVSSIPAIFREFGIGLCLTTLDPDEWTSSILDLAANGDAWKQASSRAVQAAEAFTYERFVAFLRRDVFGGGITPP
jgi:glycosyltransferase involved in cell wall biosynthesis